MFSFLLRHKYELSLVARWKDLEKGKWVKVDGWSDVNAAKAEIEKSIAAAQD